METVKYVFRRILYAIPILIGVNLITFVLFFIANTPDDVARMQLGTKHLTPEAISMWKKAHGYDLPLFYSPKQSGVQKFTQTLYFQKSIKLFTFKFGSSIQGRNINYDIMHRVWPSLQIAVPAFFIGLFINISLALLIALFRGTFFDTLALFVCVVLMSISAMFYIIMGQFVFGKWLQWVPIFGIPIGLAGCKICCFTGFDRHCQ